jgi:hypothetical protein
MWHRTYPLASASRAKKETLPPVPTRRFPTCGFFYRPGSEFKLHPIDGHPLSSDSELDIVIRSQVSVRFGEFSQNVVCQVQAGEGLVSKHVEAHFFHPLYVDIRYIPMRTRTLSMR